MASAQDLVNEACESVASGQYRLTALTAAQAIERARGAGDADALDKANYLAAEAARMLGNYPKALQHLMDGEHADDSAGLSRWRRRRVQFFILLDWRPCRSDLNGSLEEFRSLSRQFPAPRSDMHYFQACLHESVGDWASALQEASRGYRAHSGSSGGTVAYAFPELCAEMCIRLHDFSAAEDWIHSVRVKDSVEKGWGPQIAVSQAQLRLRLARARRSAISELRQGLDAVEESTRAIDEEGYIFGMHLARIRVALLDPANGDPETPWHPARGACSYRFKQRMNVHRRYAHNLKVLDFRLASLRYACGHAPVDDEFAGPPPGPLQCAAHSDLARRLRRTRAALAVAFRHARRIDAMLECTWRGEEVGRRAAWIEAIAAAAGARASDVGALPSAAAGFRDAVAS